LKITVIDYGLGNQFSVIQALKYLGYETEIDTDGTLISHAEILLIPGVAAFGQGMRNLKKRGQLETIRHFGVSGRPVIGFCLGAQMLLRSSEEDTTSGGIALVNGDVKLMSSEYGRIPNQGWHPLEIRNSSAFSGFQNKFFYFSHSYRMTLDDVTTPGGEIMIGKEPVNAFFFQENILAVQFHPELSGNTGLEFIDIAIKTANIWS
jgi:imidazole glycerol-phosphate synthase subunit HisH